MKIALPGEAVGGSVSVAISAVVASVVVGSEAVSYIEIKLNILANYKNIESTEIANGETRFLLYLKLILPYKSCGI